jgi:hypothetical protein
MSLISHLIQETNDTILPFAFPAVHDKRFTATFDGGGSQCKVA